MRLNHMNWPASSLDLKFIENCWQIIKIKDSKERHGIQSLEEIIKVIEEK